jgi:alkyl hydroperoxide reductase subunit AhpC
MTIRIGDVAPDFTADTTQGHAINYPLIGDADLTVATPVNWRPGQDVIIPTSVSDEDARKQYPQGYETLKPYLRVVAQPK